MRTLRISWEEFKSIFYIFERPETDDALWFKETESSFIFLFHKQFDIVCEVNKLDLLEEAGLLNADKETEEQFFSDFRNKYVTHARPFESFGGL